MSEKSKIITIIGSCKYEKEMGDLALKLTASGYAVYFPRGIKGTTNAYGEVVGDPITKSQLELLFRNFRTMMSLSDMVILYNKNGKIGDNTFIDLEYAMDHDIDIYAIEPHSNQFEISIERKGIIDADTPFYKLYKRKTILILGPEDVSETDVLSKHLTSFGNVVLYKNSDGKRIDDISSVNLHKIDTIIIYHIDEVQKVNAIQLIMEGYKVFSLGTYRDEDIDCNIPCLITCLNDEGVPHKIQLFQLALKGDK